MHECYTKYYKRQKNNVMLGFKLFRDTEDSTAIVGGARGHEFGLLGAPRT